MHLTLSKCGTESAELFAAAKQAYWCAAQACMSSKHAAAQTGFCEADSEWGCASQPCRFAPKDTVLHGQHSTTVTAED